MKHLVFALLLFRLSGTCSNAHYFDVDVDAIQAEFTSLTTLELAHSSDSLTTFLSPLFFSDDEAPCGSRVDFGNFMLGFLCGCCGFTIVMFTSREKHCKPRLGQDGPLTSACFGWLAAGAINVIIIAATSPAF